MMRQLLRFLFAAQFITGAGTGLSSAQDIDYARAVIDTLTSPYMAGRGYVDSGQYKAAEYIARQYEKLGLKSFEESYLQSFYHPVNTFPGRMAVGVDSLELIPGKDFLVSPSSGSLYGSFDVIWYDRDNIPEKKHFNKLVRRDFFSDKVIVIDERGVEDEDKSALFEEIKFNVFGAPAIVVVKDKKLTWSVARQFDSFVTLEIPRGKIPRTARKISIDVQHAYIRNYKSDNVIGYVEGTEFPDSFIVITGHYDHLGKMGKEVYFPGANDNASGIAMLLNLAKHYSKNPAPHSVVFMAFGAEEAGLLGSSFYTENPFMAFDNISFLVNFDILGTGGEGIKVVNGKVFTDRFKLLTSVNSNNNYLPAVSPRGEAAISDHYFFYEKGVPCFYIYTLGEIKAYHDIYDKAETLPLTEFEDVFRLVRDYLKEVTISE